jgi:hypothetical protein
LRIWSRTTKHNKRYAYDEADANQIVTVPVVWEFAGKSIKALDEEEEDWKRFV